MSVSDGLSLFDVDEKEFLFDFHLDVFIEELEFLSPRWRGSVDKR